MLNSHLKGARLLAALVAVLCLSIVAAAQDSGAGVKSSEFEEVRRLLLKQQEELERLRATVTEQSRQIEELRGRVEQRSATTTTAALVTANQVVTEPPAQTSSASNTQQDVEARVGKVEAEVKRTSETIAKQLGSITFSGDVRVRYEAFYGQLNALTNAANPAVVGNELSARNRFRLRARLQMRGTIGKEFDWALRLTTGSFADNISANQTLTDFFNRKPVGLDNAYIAYAPQRLKGLRLQGGKFDVPWLRTEMTIDNDLSVEGFNESYSRSFKKPALKNLTFVAWQLPFLERASAFVRNADGTVNLSETSRGGRDLALYGAQARARFEFTPDTGLTLAASDLYFSGTQFITPLQVFNGNLLVPVAVTIPATSTSPAQTVTAQVAIPRDLLVSGNANLGVSIASNNAVNRDGRLSSGFNLVDLIARLDLYQKSRFPVALIFDFVTNTQVRDVVVGGAGGANLLIPNNEKSGYWAELQVGRLKERGDWLLGYTFMRIEKDAVLTPFNASDLGQQSDVRVSRFSINYAADPRVILSLTGYLTSRPNGLLGVFGATPPGSLDRQQLRLQWDTTFRF